ncbi:MAG: RsmB/NOP family class I SAM-dependent RNA methyltransferase [Propionibacteriaceae bacterium]
MPQHHHTKKWRTRDHARLAAFDALQAVTLDGAYANLALAKVLAQADLDERDSGFVTELLYGTCRGIGTYDLIIEAAGGRSLDTLEAAVVDVLRLGAHQLLAMRVPTHAAVAASVDVAANVVGERATGVVNAILRKVAKHDLAAWQQELAIGLSPDAQLGMATHHPEWIVAAYRDLLPEAELQEALEANNLAPAPTLVVRPGLCEVSELGKPTKLSPFGATSHIIPSRIQQIRTGKAGVQDEGSQLVAWALSRVEAPEGLWLDMCAGPGGKASLLAGLAQQSGNTLIASEVTHHRAVLVRQALRTYLGLPTVICADGTQPPWLPRTFSRVMADVPCSGLGSLRRRPESRWRRLPEDIDDLAPLQRSLLLSALDSTVSGGVVAYVTCSPHQRETRDIVEAVLAEHDDVELLNAPDYLPEVRQAANGSYVQLWPHRHGTDAMFLALLRRR